MLRFGAIRTTPLASDPPASRRTAVLWRPSCGQRDCGWARRRSARWVTVAEALGPLGDLKRRRSDGPSSSPDFRKFWYKDLGQGPSGRARGPLRVSAPPNRAGPPAAPGPVLWTGRSESCEGPASPLTQQPSLRPALARREPGWPPHMAGRRWPEPI